MTLCFHMDFDEIIKVILLFIYSVRKRNKNTLFLKIYFMNFIWSKIHAAWIHLPNECKNTLVKNFQCLFPQLLVHWYSDWGTRKERGERQSSGFISEFFQIQIQKVLAKNLMQVLFFLRFYSSPVLYYDSFSLQKQKINTAI